MKRAHKARELES